MGISYHIRAAYGGKTHNGAKDRETGVSDSAVKEKSGRLVGY